KTGNPIGCRNVDITGYAVYTKYAGVGNGGAVDLNTWSRSKGNCASLTLQACQSSLGSSRWRYVMLARQRDKCGAVEILKRMRGLIKYQRPCPSLVWHY